MHEAGREALDCARALKASESNVVAEVLKDQGTFTEWRHYPAGDVVDRARHAQYFYHAHPHPLAADEHGHFHAFLRGTGMPRGVRPAPLPGLPDPLPDNIALAHIIAIAMNDHAEPIRLFTTNRWVTGETWYRAQDVSAMIDRFSLLAAPVATSRWLTAMVRLFAPEICALLWVRDAALESARAHRPLVEALEAHELEVLSFCDISLQERMAELARLLGPSQAAES